MPAAFGAGEYKHSGRATKVGRSARKHKETRCSSANIFLQLSARASLFLSSIAAQKVAQRIVVFALGQVVQQKLCCCRVAGFRTVNQFSSDGVGVGLRQRAHYH